jgi:hypothetical protein
MQPMSCKNINVTVERQARRDRDEPSDALCDQIRHIRAQYSGGLADCKDAGNDGGRSIYGLSRKCPRQTCALKQAFFREALKLLKPGSRAVVPWPVPWYFPPTDAVVAEKPGVRGKTKVQIFQAEGDFTNRILVADATQASQFCPVTHRLRASSWSWRFATVRNRRRCLKKAVSMWRGRTSGTNPAESRT